MNIDELTKAAERWRADAYPRETIVRLKRELDARVLADAMAAELDGMGGSTMTVRPRFPRPGR